ncbi:HAD-IIIA family hydrolase [Niveispirillum cyanobacteriorum]|uniref:HAD-IIIA family hydrolase n=1 Tax=Niveispirillum cyanobacteriorum TaxID=1612173 RepID=UPI001B3B7886|nr:HAD-IIIA family hydrolase [Niveispirillum cyanobacteriorum]
MTQAIVLVGGKGTRLGKLAENIPKPLMPIDGGSVFLDELLFNIARHGFKDIILLAGHMREQVIARYQGAHIQGSEISVLSEEVPAGTAGALTLAAARLAPTFLLANGDTLFDINLRRLDQILAHTPNSLAVLALRRMPDAGRYGEVKLQNGRITSFCEKKRDAGSGLINAGIGLFNRDILSYISSLPCSMETSVYPLLAASGKMIGEEFDGYFIDMGLPETLAQARQELPLRRKRPALFLDRDGVLNHDRGYTHRIEDLRWIDGAIETIRRANEIGALTIVVTNQAGVAKGHYGLDDVKQFHAAMRSQLASAGAHLDAIYLCPEHPEAALKQFQHENPPNRKPNPGMILQALTEWPIDIGCSALIGDRQSDLEAARRAGIPGFLFEGGNLLDLASPLLAWMAESSNRGGYLKSIRSRGGVAT